MNHLFSRREFLATSVAVGGTLLAGNLAADERGAASDAEKPLYDISLAGWSLHKAIFGKQIDHLDFAKTAKSLDIHAVEYVNQFWIDKAKDENYLKELKTRAEGEGVKSLLIMIDREGNLGDPDDAKRTQAVENHYKWVEAAKYLGCHSIRVNAGSAGSYEEQVKLAADGLRRLTEFSAQHGLNTIVENHGGLSSNGEWLAKVMKTVDHANCGTLPDFGNFRVSQNEMYDRYKGVAELMPFAKAVSAKSHDFDGLGYEIHTDYLKMMKIVLAAGYHGFVGIEYEGSKIDEIAGIKATRDLLIKVRDQIAAEQKKAT